jgi:fibronectin type 3 domain-containing protein
VALRAAGLLLFLALAAAGLLLDRTQALYVDAPQVGANTFATAYWDTLTAVADSDVSEQQPTSNFGTQATMNVTAWTSKNKRSFARFDLSSIPPGNEVLKAELSLCATTVPGSTKTYDANKVTASWNEGTISWNTQPSVDGTPTDSVTTPATPGCITWPLMKTDVEDWVVGAANDGWRVKDSVENNPKNITTFRTREDTAVPADRPSLFVVYRPCQDLTAPGAPVGLMATGGDGQVALDWADNTELDLAGYNVYRSTNPGGPHAKINAAVAPTSDYTDTGVTNDTTYYYVVTALDKCVNVSGDSSESSATPQAGPPAPPTGLVATPGSTQVALDWANNGEPDLDGYNVYRGTTTSGPYSKINGSLLGTSDYTDTGLTNGTIYYYVVRAENTSAQESGNSTEVSATPVDAPPAPPSGLVATPQNAQVSLDWSDNSEPDLSGYNVHRSTTPGGPYTKVNGPVVSASDYLDTGLSNGTTYYYVVTAVDTGSNESGNSSEAGATPAATPPAAPTGLIATAGQDQVSLDWNDNSEPDLAGYNVYRSTTASGPYTKVNGSLVAVSAYTDTGLTGGVTYYYVVRAENTGAQESGNSNESSATPYSVLIAAASADAYVSEQKSNSNYGSATEIIVKSKNNQADRGFVQFDVSSIAAGSTVSSATLTLCSTAVAGSRTYNAHRVTAAWAEGSVTWGNQPGVGASPTTSATTPASPGCMSWTVTADVQAWVDGTANNGWRISDSVETDNATSKFRSREDTAVPAEQPELQVNFTSP